MQYRESHDSAVGLGFPPPPGLEHQEQPTTELEQRIASLEQVAGVEWCGDCIAHHPIEGDPIARRTRLSGGGVPLSGVTGSGHSASLTAMGPGSAGV